MALYLLAPCDFVDTRDRIKHPAAQVIEHAIGRAGALNIGRAGNVLKIEENYRNDVVGWPQHDRTLPAHHLGRVLLIEIERPMIIAAADQHQLSEQGPDIHQHGIDDLGTLARVFSHSSIGTKVGS